MALINRLWCVCMRITICAYMWVGVLGFRWVRLLMVKRSMCQKNFVITDKMVCAKGATEGSDSCQGERGLGD